MTTKKTASADAPAQPETPPIAVEQQTEAPPVVVEEQPPHGGSFVRNEDGTLRLAECTRAAEPAAADKREEA